MENIQHEFFIWEENNYIEQKKNDKNNNESVHYDTTTEINNDLTQKDWKDITDPKERTRLRNKAYKKNNRDKIRIQNKSYRENNKDKYKDWYEANKNKRKRAEIDLSDQEKDSLDKRVTRCQIKKTKK